IAFYPNPADDQVEIDLAKTYTEIKLRIHNVLGQELREAEVFYHQQKLRVDLPAGSGIFLIHLEVDGKMAVLKLLKN
ncbi:MAG: T9SS type A sorting domain-containing protein, partial [Bacteroidota bacterium]